MTAPSLAAGDWRCTTPAEPSVPVVAVGDNYTEAGGCWGVSVSCVEADAPL
jgi:hypothetical protein